MPRWWKDAVHEWDRVFTRMCPGSGKCFVCQAQHGLAMAEHTEVSY